MKGQQFANPQQGSPAFSPRQTSPALAYAPATTSTSSFDMSSIMELMMMMMVMGMMMSMMKGMFTQMED